MSVRPIAAVVIVVSTLAGTAACTHSVRRPDPPAEVLATAEAHRARVWRGEDSIVLLSPRVVGDSLLGWKAPLFGSSPGERIAIPLEEVDGFGVEEWDHAGTGLVLTGSGLLWYLLLGVLLREG